MIRKLTFTAIAAASAVLIPAPAQAIEVLTPEAQACLDANPGAIYAFSETGRVAGTEGDDTFCVSRNIDSSIIEGSAGNDTYLLLDNGDAPLRVDVARGDEGVDTVSLERWTHAYDGDWLWGNTVIADVERVALTPFDDRLGDPNMPCLASSVAEDTTYLGIGGSDTFNCVKGTVVGGTGNDVFDGIVTGTIVYGGAGADTAMGDAGADVISLGAGPDVAYVEGGGADLVRGGRGADVVEASRNDDVKSAKVS